jgi:PAS domain-containing protein
VHAFRARALDVRRPPGAEIVLHDPVGRLLATTAAPAEVAPLPAGDGTARSAVASGRPQVSDLLPPAGVGQPPGFLVVAPVRNREGETLATLGLLVPVPVLARLFREEETPPGMAAALLDRQGNVVAAHRPSPAVPRLAADVLARVEGGGEGGWMAVPAADGSRLVAAFARSEVAGWTAVVYLTEAGFLAPLHRSLLLAALASLLLAALAGALAHGFARRIARPIEALAGAAGARGEAAPRPETPLREVNAVARALAASEAEARRRAAEREALLGTLDLAGVFVRDPGGRITLWTSGMERLLGWRRDQALGRVSHELLGTVFPRPLAEIEAELLRKGEW